MSALRRLGALLGSLMPHSGGLRESFAQIYINIPAGQELDATCLSGKPTFDSGYDPPNAGRRSWNLPDRVWGVKYDEGMAEQDYIAVQTGYPAASGTSSYRLVIRLKTR